VKEVEEFLRKKIGMSNTTKEHYRYILTSFFETVGKKPDEVTEDDIVNFIKRVEKKSSQRTYLQILSSFFKERNPKLSEFCRNSARGVKYPFKRVYLTKEEAEAFFRQIDNFRDKLMFAIMLFTGVRVSELINIKKKDIDMDELSIEVVGKESKARKVFFPEKIANALRKYISKLRDDDRLFPLTRVEVFQLCRYYAKKAGIKKRISPHVFRHTFAVNFLKKGGSIHTLQQLLGHSSLAPTTAYLAMVGRDLREEYMRVMK